MCACGMVLPCHRLALRSCTALLTEIFSPDDEGIVSATGLLRAGLTVAIPTETVYGLAADATSGQAVAAVFAAKGRPGFNPLICHYHDAAAAAAHVVFAPQAERLAEAFWPGPLTLVLPRRPACPVHALAGAGLPTLAVRVPSHPVARALLAACGFPLAAPSANRSGGVSPTTAAHVLADLDGRIAAVLDAGACAVGLESSVVDLSRGAPWLLRHGGIPAEAIEACIGRLERGHTPGAAPVSPGLLASHYAPALPLRLHADHAGPEEALLAFGAPLPSDLVFNLSASGDLAEAASRLFAGLRWLDREGQARGLRGIAAMAVPDAGLGAAINDRLRRASVGSNGTHGGVRSPDSLAGG
jgi:L-threonylcarbamoyladenylate synthase